MSIDEAVAQLEFNDKKGAKIMKEVLLEAQEMAVKTHNVEYKSNLHVGECDGSLCCSTTPESQVKDGRVRAVWLVNRSFVSESRGSKRKEEVLEESLLHGSEGETLLQRLRGIVFEEQF
uniref:Large ribosomal subunit protein uL22m n=1 Tax=Oryzias sinensis TaxID=183150 RepID=A0A8C7WS03_9TELE